MTIAVAWKGSPIKIGNSWAVTIPMDYVKYGLVDPEKEHTFKVELSQEEQQKKEEITNEQVID